MEAIQEKEPTEVADCKFIGTSEDKNENESNEQILSKYELKDRAVQKQADTVVFDTSSSLLTGSYYKCNKQEQDWEEVKLKKVKAHDNNDFSLFFGRYIERQGILKEAGELGLSLGAQVDIFSHLSHDKDLTSRNSHGYFLLWTFDHFWNTKVKLLKVEFKNQDFTNYMFGGGYAFRRIITDRIQFHYRGGLAINFLEIDTFGTDEENDDKYTDITISTIHKLGIDFLVSKVDSSKILRQPQIRIGPSLFYYFAPSPLGKFKVKEKNENLTPGGSLALQFDLKFEFY